MMRLQFFASLLGVALLSSACSERPCSPDACIDRTYMHKYGMKVRPDDWQTRGQNGQVISTLRNGVRVSQTFANGQLNGDCCYTFPNSECLQKVETYCNDDLIKEVTYYPSGVPYSSTEYSAPDIRIVTIWYENGNPKSVEKYERDLLITGEYYNINHQRDSWVYNGIGERMMRDNYGQFLSMDNFRGGQLASRTTYHSNGTPKEITPYQEGVVHGERKTYYPGGEPMSIETWTQGQQNGITTIYQNGEKYADVPYLSNKKNGVERRFKDGSNVSQEISWYNDKMHGPTYTYVGDSVQTDWFYNGRLTTRSDYESFNIPKKASMKNPCNEVQ